MDRAVSEAATNRPWNIRHHSIYIRAYIRMQQDSPWNHAESLRERMQASGREPTTADWEALRRSVRRG